MRLSKGIASEDFTSSEVFQLAAAMAVAQIGEVSGRLMKKWPAFCLEHQELELVRSNAMRHRLIHGYDQIDMATLWDTIQSSVPEMLDAVGKLLSESDRREP